MNKFFQSVILIVIFIYILDRRPGARPIGVLFRQRVGSEFRLVRWIWSDSATTGRVCVCDEYINPAFDTSHGHSGVRELQLHRRKSRSG